MLLVGFLAVYERFVYTFRLGNNRNRRLFMCSLLFSTVEVFCCSCGSQVPATSHYSMVFYFVAPNAPQLGSLLQRFVDGDDNFRNSRFKLIPSVPKVIHCPPRYSSHANIALRHHLLQFQF
jgi:hypothetical protein